jgi:ElaB/YqjD/DUF883 family membrane-anchored ribosome-binding protein
MASASVSRSGRDRASVEAALRRSREQLSSSLDEFQRSLQHTVVAPREWVRTHVWACVAGAFAIGFLLGRR